MQTQRITDWRHTHSIDNHKPETNPSFSKLRVAGPSKYDLSYNDNGIYKYQGSRSGDGGQYVLIFDPSREVFVLHKVDSLFTMNLTQTPTQNSAAKLRQEFPHLEKPSKVSSGITIPIHEKAKETSKAPAAAKGAKDSSTAPAKGKQKKELPAAAAPRSAPKAAPAPAAPAPAPKKRTTPPSDDEEDSDDDDGGLVLEFPGGEEPSRDFSPAFPPRRFSEFVANGEEDDEDADGEEEEEDDMSEEEHFKLPSPMNPQKTQQQQQQQQSSSQQPQTQQSQQPTQMEVESEEDEEEEEEEQAQDDDFEADLAAALEAELAASEGDEADDAGDAGDASEVSEEE